MLASERVWASMSVYGVNHWLFENILLIRSEGNKNVEVIIKVRCRLLFCALASESFFENQYQTTAIAAFAAAAAAIANTSQ